MPIDVGGVRERLGVAVPAETIYEAVKALKQRGVLRFVQGSRRWYELVPGVPEPVDLRGKAEGSAVARRSAIKRRAARGLHHGVVRR